MSDNETLTFKEVANALAKIQYGEPSSAQIDEAYKKLRNALDIIINPTLEQHIKLKEMGINVR